MKCGHREGFSLLEVVLATAVLLGCVIVLSHIAFVGRSHMESADQLSIAQLACQTRLNEMLSGAAPIQPVAGEPIAELPGWSLSVAASSRRTGAGRIGDGEAKAATATGQGPPASTTLVRWIAHNRGRGQARCESLARAAPLTRPGTAAGDRHAPAATDCRPADCRHRLPTCRAAGRMGAERPAVLTVARGPARRDGGCPLPRVLRFDNARVFMTHRSASSTFGRPAPRFTLLEVLIASVLIAVLMAAVWHVLDLYSDMFERGERRTEESQLVRTLAQQFSDDLAGAIQDPVFIDPDSPGPTGARRFGLYGSSRELRIDVLQIPAFETAPAVTGQGDRGCRRAAAPGRSSFARSTTASRSVVDGTGETSGSG